MSLTTTDSLSGKKPKDQRCSQCQERSPHLIIGEMNRLLCPKCAPPNLVIGHQVIEE